MMGNVDEQEEDLYDFQFDVAATDPSVEEHRDSHFAEFDLNLGAAGSSREESGVEEELARFKAEEGAGVQSGGSLAAYKSTISAEPGVEAVSSPRMAEVSKHIIVANDVGSREDLQAVQSCHQLVLQVKGMNSIDDEAGLKKSSRAGGDETQVLKALNGKLEAAMDLDLKKRQLLNGSQFVATSPGSTEHEKPSSTPTRTPPRRALGVAGNSWATKVPDPASSTAEHVKLAAIKVHSKLDSGADSLPAKDRKLNSGFPGPQFPALIPTRSILQSSQRRRSLAASYPVSDSIHVPPSSPPPEHPRKFFTDGPDHHHSMSISKSPRYVAPTIAASLKIVSAKQIPSKSPPPLAAGLFKSLPNKSTRSFCSHVGDTLSMTTQEFKPATHQSITARPRIKEEQQTHEITAARIMSGSKSESQEACATKAYPALKVKSHSSIPEATSFKFRCEERAERRRDFYEKLEDRLRAKAKAEAKAMAEAKEAKEAQLKMLRRSLTYKANPVPSFYQEPPPPPTELKRIPLTRPKSPKFTPSRRRSTGQTVTAPDQIQGAGPKLAIQRCSLDGGGVGNILRSSSTHPNVKRLPNTAGLSKESVNQGAGPRITRNRSITTSRLKTQTSANSNTAKSNKDQHSAADSIVGSSEKFRNLKIATTRSSDSSTANEISSAREVRTRRFANSREVKDQDPATTQNTTSEIGEQSTRLVVAVVDEEEEEEEEEDSVDEHGRGQVLDTDAEHAAADEHELRQNHEFSLSPETSADHDRRKLWSSEELAKLHSSSRRRGGGAATAAAASSAANVNGIAAATTSYASVKDIVMEFSRRLGTTPPSISHQN